MPSMTKKKANGDRHKRKTTQLRLHPILRQQLEILAERNATTLTAEIATSIRERLERNGLWPAPPSTPGDGTTRKD